MKAKLKDVSATAHAIASEIENNTTRKSVTLKALKRIQDVIADILAEMEDRVVFVDESESISESRTIETLSELENKIMFILQTNPPLTVRAIQKKIVPRLQPFVTEPYMRSLVVSGKVAAVPRNKGAGRTGWLFSIPKEQSKTVLPPAKKPYRRKRRVARQLVYEVDGLLTKHGVAAKLGVSAYQVEKLFALAKNERNFFPLPASKKHVGAYCPANVWKPEDIDAYKEMIKEETED
jgi:phage FluMu protein gp41